MEDREVCVPEPRGCGSAMDDSGLDASGCGRSDLMLEEQVVEAIPRPNEEKPDHPPSAATVNAITDNSRVGFPLGTTCTLTS